MAASAKTTIEMIPSLDVAWTAIISYVVGHDIAAEESLG
jgi:hypothetical protein